MYAELHAKTNFSFLEGASHPDELVCRAAELGYRALAVTDRNSLAGVVRAHGAAKDEGLKLIVGAEITPDDAPPVVLWATDRAAYGRLVAPDHPGRRRAEKGECRLRFDDVAEHAEGTVGGSDAGERAEDGEQWESWAVAEGTTCRASCQQSSRRSAPLALPAPLSSPTATCSATAATLLAELHCGPDDRRTFAAAAGNLAADAASRWWRPATCIITCPSERRCTTC